MANTFTKPRGTVDMIGAQAEKYQKIVQTLNEKTHLYGVSPIIPPMFEENKLFHRGVGETTDIVTKETFNLENKGGHEYTLRPEFTAGIMRAVIENKLYASPHMPLKLYYSGSIFRYERPQAGRLREPHQWGIEFLDEHLDEVTTIEVLLLMVSCLKAIGIENPILKINTLGSLTSRIAYKSALVDYFVPYIDSMCADCKSRLETNPLRILDCKVEEDKKIASNAPIIRDYLTDEDKQEFEGILAMLKEMGIEYEIDDHLVRGLDYYTGIVFEVYEKNHLNLGALGGGGKYDGLSKALGGPNLEGIGFSFGLDRLLLSLEGEDKEDPIDVMLYIQDDVKSMLKLAEELRKKNLSTTIPHVGKSLKSALKMADSKGVKRFIFKKDDSYVIKDMEKNEQKECSYEDIINNLSLGGK